MLKSKAFWVIVLVFIMLYSLIAIVKESKAEESVIYETFKFTDIPNYTKPRGVVTDDGTIYDTFGKTGVPDYSKPTGKIVPDLQIKDD